MKKWGISMMLTWAIGAQAANYVWNGNGVSGGTGNSAWETAGNWLVSGTPPATAPGASDNVSITLGVDYAGTSVVITAGAMANDVICRGIVNANRKVGFTGNATFSTLDFASDQGSGASTCFGIVSGATLTLTGGVINAGTVVMHTLKAPQPFSVYSTLRFNGQIRCTGTQVALSISAIDGNLYVDHPDAEIHFMNTTMRFGGNLYVRSTQKVIGFNASGIVINRETKDLYSIDGGPLTNWSACNIGGLSYRMDSGAPFTLPAGTYNSLSALWTSTGAGEALYAISGDIILDGQSAAGNALLIERNNLDNSRAELDLQGNNLTIVGAAPIQIGEFSTTNVTYRSFLITTNSTVTTDGNIRIGPTGYITGNSNTVIALEGNWDNRSIKTNNFALAQSTLKFVSDGSPGAPSLLEVQCRDLGENLAGQVNANFAFGKLIIGEPGKAIYVQLSDLTDSRKDGQADALYVGELVINAGSSLDMKGIGLYVNGVSARGRWHAFGEGLLYDSTIPGSVFTIL